MIDDRPAFGKNGKPRLRNTMLLACMACTPVLAGMMSSAISDNGSTPVQQDQAVPTSTEDRLKRVLGDSGVLAQLTNLPPIIIGESLEQWQRCDSYDAQLKPWLKDAFAADRITQIAIDNLHNALDSATILNILQWLDSPSGQAIVHAERASASLSDDDYNYHINQLGTSPTYRTERAPRIRALISTTRAGDFVSIFNTELNSIVKLSIACSPSSENVQQLLETARKERQDLSLVSFFMNIELMAPTAVAYRHLEDCIIDDYLAFSKSRAGKAYHAAMIDVTQATLIDRLEAVASRISLPE